MTVNRDAGAALVLLAAFLGYGYQATLIELFPGQETEVFSPRTLPYALAAGGILSSILQLLRSLRVPATEAPDTTGFDWQRAAMLCVVMLLYGWLFTPLGFVIATTLFLAAGFLILGERRILVLSVLPPLFTVLFWAVMSRGLGLYLAPGLLGI
jgi:putative tricarboxylic transport membrane protein